MLRTLLPLLIVLLAPLPAAAQVAEPTLEEGLSEQKKPWGPELFLFGASAGMGRSWTGELQASSLRVALGGHRPWLAAGVEVDWVTDNRWRTKARTYQRAHFRLFGALDLAPFPAMSVWIGAGVGGGVYRGGGVHPAIGVFEFVQFNIHIKQGLMGVRIEQQQTWQPDTNLPEDHVTGFFFMVGGLVGT